MKWQGGQAMVIAVLALGVIMACIVFFGAARNKDSNDMASHMVAQQQALQALSAAAKRVQSMYANEAGCDPTALNSRLSNLPNLPTTPATLGFTYAGTNVSYVVVFPEQSGVAARSNLCSSASGKGCRQLAVPVDRKVFVVTVGAVSADSDATTAGRTGDCPRDSSVFLSTAIAPGSTGSSRDDRKAVYTQNVTLTNVCSYKACNSDLGGWGFDAPGTITLSGALSTTACTGSYTYVRATKYGGGITALATNTMSLDDLRWARRYLETGGEGVGETNFFYGLNAPSNENGACPASPTDYSGGQCLSRPCFPMLDLNRDYKNNEEDLGIMEHFMRGYITTLPVNEL